MAATALDLLLLGKTGNGKSALGNAILMRSAFNSGCSASSVTTRVCIESASFNGRQLNVVDTPGIGDTRSQSSEEEVKRSVSTVEEMMRIRPSGYHAFLFVTRFGARFTEEDKQSLELLKTVLGRDVMRRFAVVVVTCGDNFRVEEEEAGVSFEQWVGQQTGAFRDLVTECQHRVVLFDNMTREQGRREAQLNALLTRVEQVGRSSPARYTPANFQLTAGDRQRVIVAAEEPRICSDAIQQVTQISEELRRIMTNSSANQVDALRALLSRCDRLNSSIQAQDKGTGALASVLTMVRPTHSSVSDALNTQVRAAEQRERARILQEEETRRMQEKLRREQEEMRRRQEQERQEAERRMEAQRRAEQQRREEEERRSRERERELQLRLEKEQEERRRQEEELRRVRAQRPRSRSPPVERKVVREVNRVVNQVGRLFRL